MAGSLSDPAQACVRCSACRRPLPNLDVESCPGCGEPVDPVTVATTALEEYRFHRVNRWVGVGSLTATAAGLLLLSWHDWHDAHQGEPTAYGEVALPLLLAPMALWPCMIVALPVWLVLLIQGRRTRSRPLSWAAWLALSAAWFLGGILAIAKLSE